MVDLLTTLSAAVIGGGIAAAAGEWHASRRFKREIQLSNRQHAFWVDEQFWARKADTYAQICEAVWEEMAYAADYEDYMHDFSGDSKPPKEVPDWEERRLFLRKQGEIGGIFLSDDAVAELKKFYVKYSKAISHPDVETIVVDVYSCCKECLAAMLEISKRDLRPTQEA